MLDKEVLDILQKHLVLKLVHFESDNSYFLQLREPEVEDSIVIELTNEEGKSIKEYLKK